MIPGQLSLLDLLQPEERARRLTRMERMAFYRRLSPKNRIREVSRAVDMHWPSMRATARNNIRSD